MKISVGIPIYNAELYLRSAISSVLEQTYTDWELILIDDGSTDNSLSIAKEYESKDSRIRVISDGLNKKLPLRLNQLVDESKYEYIARMDADDIMHPQRLERQLDFLVHNPQFDLVSTGAVSIDHDNIVCGSRNVSDIRTNFTGPFKKNPILHPSVFARKSWFLRNRYSSEYPRCEDSELWSRAIVKSDFKMAVLPDLLLYYREAGNIDATKIINTYEDGFKVYSKYFGGFSLKQYTKITAKKAVVLTLDRLGKLDMLIGLRNKADMDTELVAEHQRIINSICQKHFSK